MNDRVTLRLAVEGDVPDLGRIDVATEPMFAAAGHPEFVGGGTIPDDVARRAIAEGRITIAELDDQGVKVVGWLYRCRSQGELCVGQLSVDPAWQRRGVGAALLDDTLASARSAGEPSVVLNTQDDLAWNRPWYEKFGFRVVAPKDWNEDMHAIAAEQTEQGLDWNTRVHMRVVLGS